MAQYIYCVQINGIIRRRYTQFYPAWLHAHNLRKAQPGWAVALWRYCYATHTWQHA